MCGLLAADLQGRGGALQAFGGGGVNGMVLAAVQAIQLVPDLEPHALHDGQGVPALHWGAQQNQFTHLAQ